MVYNDLKPVFLQSDLVQKGQQPTEAQAVRKNIYKMDWLTHLYLDVSKCLDTHGDAIVTSYMEGDAWILAMVKISYRFLALTEIDLKHCYKMTGPTSFCSKCCLLQNDTPSRKHTPYKMVWFRGKMLLQNDSVC